METTYLGAWLAGLVSFLSPCVLPLVPGYISMLSGFGVDQLRKGEGARGTLLWSATCFVVGFSSVFVAMGAGATTLGKFLQSNRGALAPIAGAVIILFGLHLVGWLVKIPIRVGLITGALMVAAGVILKLTPAISSPIRPRELFAGSIIFLAGPYLSGLLTRDIHLRNVGGQPGMIGAFLLGFAFALGWTPCIGPILGAVLLIAGAQDTALKGVLLLLSYSAGLAIPFMLTALGVGQFMNFYQKFRKHLHTVEVVGGVLLLFLGALVFTNRATWLAGKFSFVATATDSVTARSAQPVAAVKKLSTAGMAMAPDLEMKDLNGVRVNLKDYAGKVVLVNFWATWCDPCRAEIPWLIDLRNKYNKDGFEILGVAMDEEGKSAVQPFLDKERFDVNGQKVPIQYPILIGDGDLVDKFMEGHGGIIGMPTSVLISRDGKWVHQTIGPVDPEQLERDILGLL